MFTRVLIPVDGSDPATRAAKFGLELAAAYDAVVDVLHVQETHSLTGDEHEAAENDRERDVLQAVTDLDVKGDPSVETHLAEGRAHSAISAHVDEYDVDLVVMGHRGRTGLAKRLLGSVTERVLRETVVPVLAVPGDDTGPETGQSCENILLTTDGSDVSKQAVPYAADLAEQLEATLHLVTVVNVETEAGLFDAGGVSEEMIERLEAEGRTALDQLVEELDTTAIDLQTSLLKGEVHTEIETYASENDIDLLVMASEGETNLVGQQLGSTARRVLQTVDRPVLVIPTPS